MDGESNLQGFLERWQPPEADKNSMAQAALLTSDLLESDHRKGEVIAEKYQLQRLVAQSAMGVVYEATQLAFDRRVAIMLLHEHEEPDFSQRFLTAASTCARLVHRHIVTVHDYGEDTRGELYFAMEFLDGKPLSIAITREERFAPERASQIALQIGRALRTAHKKGIVHGDLKPENIMILGDDEQENIDFIKVLDFGLAKLFQKVGAPRYMAPEQFQAQDADVRSDVYSLGALLFQMLAGRPAFAGQSREELGEQHMSHPIPPLSQIVTETDFIPELEIVITRCMAKSPEDRYQSMEDLISDIKAAYRLITGASIATEIFDTGELSSELVISPPPSQLSELAQAAKPQVPAPDLSPRALPPRKNPPAFSAASVPDEDIDWPKERRIAPVVIIALILAFVLVFATVAVRRETVPAQAPHIEVTLNSSPPGAQVRIDGELIGTTPLIYKTARRGVVRFAFWKEGRKAISIERALNKSSVSVEAALPKAAKAEDKALLKAMGVTEP